MTPAKAGGGRERGEQAPEGDGRTEVKTQLEAVAPGRGREREGRRG